MNPFELNPSGIRIHDQMAFSPLNIRNALHDSIGGIVPRRQRMPPEDGLVFPLYHRPIRQRTPDALGWHADAVDDHIGASQIDHEEAPDPFFVCPLDESAGQTPDVQRCRESCADRNWIAVDGAVAREGVQLAKELSAAALIAGSGAAHANECILNDSLSHQLRARDFPIRPRLKISVLPLRLVEIGYVSVTTIGRQRIIPNTHQMM